MVTLAHARPAMRCRGCSTADGIEHELPLRKARGSRLARCTILHPVERQYRMTGTACGDLAFAQAPATLAATWPVPHQRLVGNPSSTVPMPLRPSAMWNRCMLIGDGQLA